MSTPDRMQQVAFYLFAKKLPKSALGKKSSEFKTKVSESSEFRFENSLKPPIRKDGQSFPEATKRAGR